MCFLFLILMCIVSSLAYNIDVKNAQIFTDPKEATVNERKSYFGFSVALYVDLNNWENSLILVGAPRANITLVKTVTEPGSVFKCLIGSGGSCKEWILDPTEDGDIKFRSRTTSQLRDNAWTGSTIAIKNGTNPTVVVLNLLEFNHFQKFLENKCTLNILKFSFFNLILNKQ